MPWKIHLGGVYYKNGTCERCTKIEHTIHVLEQYLTKDDTQPLIWICLGIEQWSVSLI